MQLFLFLLLFYLPLLGFYVFVLVLFFVFMSEFRVNVHVRRHVHNCDHMCCPVHVSVHVVCRSRSATTATGPCGVRVARGDDPRPSELTMTIEIDHEGTIMVGQGLRGRLASGATSFYLAGAGGGHDQLGRAGGRPDAAECVVVQQDGRAPRAARRDAAAVTRRRRALLQIVLDAHGRAHRRHKRR